MKPKNRQRIERCLEQLDAWRASGTALKKYTDLNGHSYFQWRAWLGFEAHWRQTLGGTPATFVQARPAQGAATTPSSSSTCATGLRITVQRHSGADAPLSAHIDWPLERTGAPSASAAWLRQVLA